MAGLGVLRVHRSTGFARCTGCAEAPGSTVWEGCSARHFLPCLASPTSLPVPIPTQILLWRGWEKGENKL